MLFLMGAKLRAGFRLLGGGNTSEGGEHTNQGILPGGVGERSVNSCRVLTTDCGGLRIRAERCQNSATIPTRNPGTTERRPPDLEGSRFLAI